MQYMQGGSGISGTWEPVLILLIYEMPFRPRVVSGSRRLRRRLVAWVTLRPCSPGAPENSVLNLISSLARRSPP